MQEPISISKDPSKGVKITIQKMKEDIANLKLENDEMEKKLNENEFFAVIQNYEELFKKVWIEREKLVHQNLILDKHVSNLEVAYYKLVEKFVRAKLTIEGLMENQNELLETLNVRKDLLIAAENKYLELKKLLESKIEETHCDINTKERDGNDALAKLKAKVFHSQAKIDELEKRVQVKDINQKESIFAPLKNKITKIN